MNVYGQIESERGGFEGEGRIIQTISIKLSAHCIDVEYVFF